MLAQAVVTRGLGLLSTALLARLLTPTDWGSVQAVVQTASTMAQTLKLSIDAGLQIRLSETERAASDPSDAEFLGSGLLLLLVISLFGLFLGLALGGPTAKLFGDAALAPFMSWAGWLAAGQLISQIGVVLLAFGAVRTLAFAHVALNSAYLALIVIAYFLDVRGLLLGLTTQLFLHVGLGLTLLALAARAWRARNIAPKLTRMWITQGDLLRIGLPVHSAAAVPALVSLFVSANLARTSGISGLAELRVVATLNQIVTLLPGSMAVAFLTGFAGARGSAQQVLPRDLLRYIRLILANAILVATTIAWTANWLVPLAFGSTYSSVVKLTSLGVATTVIIVVKQAILTGLMSERRTGYALADALISSIVYASLAAWLQPRFGIAGMLGSELIGHLTALIILAGLLSGRFVHAETAVPALKAASVLTLTLIALVFSFSAHDSAWGPVLYIPVLVALSASVPWALFTRDERSTIFQLIGARWQRMTRER
jgi:O-antigen/teichoic acid export membrane protein